MYLNANEINATIKNESFTIDNTNYYIVNISKKPTFLVKIENLSLNGTNKTIENIILNKTEIENTLKAYYEMKYTINTSEVNALKLYFIIFNESRNDGTLYPKQEEYVCRRVLLLDHYPCKDNTSCLNTSKSFCILYGRYIGCTKQDMFLKPIQEFAFSSDGIDALLDDIINKLDTLDINNSRDYINQIKENIPLLKNYTSYIENTIFRIPSPGQTCPGCYGACPDMDLNQTSLDLAEKMINNISLKIAPLIQYKLIAELIYNNTQLHIQENLNLNIRLYYNSTYMSLKSKADQIKNLTNQVLERVDNATMKLKLSHLSIMETEIESMINTNNFTLLNESLANYTQIIQTFNSSIKSTITVYNNVSDAYRDATVYMFLIDGKALAPEDNSKRSVLKQTKMLLDQQFKTGLNVIQYEGIKAQYESLIADEKALVSKTSITQTLYLLTGISNKLINGLDIIILQISPLTYAQKAQVSSYLPFGMSFAIFLSFSSAVFLLFLIYYAITTKPINKIVFVMLTILLVFLIGIISIGLFFSMDKSLSKMEYSDYLNLIKYTKKVAIVIPQNNSLDKQTYISIKACASSIATELINENITSSIYEIGPKSCMINNTEIKNCLDKNTYPIIMLNASSISSVSYAGLLIKQASIFGDRAFYDVCPFAKILKLP